MQKLALPGPHTASMLGSPEHPKIITVAISTIYYVPKTSGYRVSVSANLFPQHCIALPYSNVTHVQELAEEIQMMLGKITNK